MNSKNYNYNTAQDLKKINSITAFENILENKNTIQHLKKLSLNNMVSHSYIIDGYDKVGKETIAREFAKLLLCENKGYVNNCNCLSCISLKTNNNPDFFFIDTKSESLSVSDIKEKILKNIETKPFKYKYKIFIIKNAHTMSIQTQNMLLKTIEEPPEFAIFILLSKNYTALLPTILSRCMLFKVDLLSEKQIKQYLINTGISEENANFFSSYSRGSLGNALEFSKSEDFFNFKKNIFNDISNLNSLDLIEIYKLIEKYEAFKNNKNNKDNKDNKNDIINILDMYMLVYRDALVYKQTNNTSTLIQQDINDLPLIEKISNMSVLNLANKITAILDAKIQLKTNANFNMIMECLFVKLRTK